MRSCIESAIDDIATGTSISKVVDNLMELLKPTIAGAAVGAALTGASIRNAKKRAQQANPGKKIKYPLGIAARQMAVGSALGAGVGRAIARGDLFRGK